MDRVCAVIVTYNRKELLRECLQAVLSQTRPPDHVLVVDNASTDGTREMLKEEFPQVEVLALPENQGGAGGFHEGMKRAYEAGYDWIWVMDDDAFPRADALALLLERAGEAKVLVPLLQSSEGHRYGAGYWKGGYKADNLEALTHTPLRVEIFAFVGPLFHREVVKRVGFPRKEFFIWFDDVEYALRIRKQGIKVLLVPGSVVVHDNLGRRKKVSFLGRSKLRVDAPAWKLYYGVRNWGWTILWTPYAKPRMRSLVAYIARNFREGLGDLVYEQDRWTRVTLRLLGMWHALTGKLGRIDLKNR
ncbi:glycosyltransferase family 2 protein [Thermus antranikianii]|uniref:glycosyltransferase family 2 protein n=1 Tax=Thermus antranikianii TaxID=88190 RepID=UPI000402ACD3|nr:glycosyltransferase family 2 protein [Thermus antranikianii]